jgi:ABC-type amino acid transport substrate-binding protein
MRLRIVATAAALCGVLAAPALAEPLAVCLEESSPPYSYRFGEREGGFDLRLAEALAGRLGQALKLQWFETEQDSEEALGWQLNALLSDRRCDLLAGFALIAAGLGKPEAARYGLPDYEGMAKADRRRMVELQPLIASEPYLRTTLAVAMAPQAPERAVSSLGDLAGVRVGVEVGTLAGALVHAYRNGALTAKAVGVPANTDLLARLAKGDFDAALVELHKAERYNRRKPDAPVRITGYRHPVGFNLGYAALADAGDLVRRVNAALQELRADGTLARIAGEEGISYVPPQQPAVFRQLTPAMLLGG